MLASIDREADIDRGANIDPFHRYLSSREKKRYCLAASIFASFVCNRYPADGLRGESTIEAGQPTSALYLLFYHDFPPG